MFISSTPSITFEFDDTFDLTELDKIELTFKSDKPCIGKYNRTYALNEVQIVPADHTITVQMTQEETSKMHGSTSVEVQIKYKLKSGMVDYTNIVSIPVDRVLKESIL